jgi:stage IV sporulation protein FB
LFGGLAATAITAIQFYTAFPAPLVSGRLAEVGRRPIVPDLPEIGIIRIFIDRIVIATVILPTAGGAIPMLFAEPGRTDYDLYFRIFGFPVRVHPAFWLIGLLLGMNSGDVRRMLLWVAAIFVSILLHELGHAAAMRWFGIRSSIVLYSFGGLTIPYDGDASRYHAARTGEQILISFAGPGAGFLLSLTILGIIYALGSGDQVYYGPLIPGLPYLDIMPNYLSEATIEKYRIMQVYAPSLGEIFLQNIFFINIYWGLVNLLPVLPLDGGHISQEICQAINARQGVRWSLQISVAVAGMVAAANGWFWIKVATTAGEKASLQNLLMNSYFFLAALFGYLAYQSYLILQSYTRHRGW